jgi:hypothetical protein
MCHPSPFLAYFSPETMLPLSSIIATIAGFALLIKRSSFRFVAHHVRSALKSRGAARPTSAPHIRVPEGELSRTGSGPGQ